MPILLRILHDDDEVVLTQAEAFKKRIPILYAILIVSTALVSFTHYAAGNVLVTAVAPGVIIALMCVRLLHWRKLQTITFTVAAARKVTKSTTYVGTILAVLLLAWSLTLLNFDVEPSSPGYMTGDGHVVLYVCMTVISCICLLMHVRAAAMLITLAIVPVFCTALIWTASTIEIAIAINLLLVAAGMSYVLMIFASDFEGMVRSKADLRELNDKNAKLANTDAVTGLPNRRHIFAEMKQATQQRTGFAIVLLDLDGFKQVNDVYGHLVGDQLLVEVGRRLVASVPPHASVARMGGDEFAIILPGVHSESEALDLGWELIATFRAPAVLSNVITTVGASVGISIAPANGESAAEADYYKRADYALFHAKKMGRGRAELFSPEHEQTILRDSAIEQALRCADFDRQISVMYQPIVDSADGAIRAYEALSRWNSPDLGLVPPCHFIPVAERSDIIHRLTRTVLSKALATAAKWPDDIGLKVNLSIRDLTLPEQVLHLISIVRDSSIAPSRLAFEITESALIEDMETFQSALRLIRALGCSVAIDDFGTGYSNLGYIHRLVPDTIRIDRSFVERLGTDETAVAIVKTIVELCHNVGARALAEGAETAAQVEILKSLGCDEIQGFHFGRPMTADEIAARLRASALTGDQLADAKAL